MPLREGVPPGCPEAYQFDRFTSGSEVGWGPKGLPLSRIRKEDFPTDSIVANFVYKVTICDLVTFWYRLDSLMRARRSFFL